MAIFGNPVARLQAFLTSSPTPQEEFVNRVAYWLGVEKMQTISFETLEPLTPYQGNSTIRGLIGGAVVCGGIGVITDQNDTLFGAALVGATVALTSAQLLTHTRENRRWKSLLNSEALSERCYSEEFAKRRGELLQTPSMMWNRQDYLDAYLLTSIVLTKNPTLALAFNSKGDLCLRQEADLDDPSVASNPSASLKLGR